jgi:type IV pilus assembly protein PilM
MRPVFNDMVTEIQRSLSFFKQLNKKSEIENMLVMGNTAKMPGLLQFLNKNLGLEVELFDRFPKLGGPEVLGAQPFKENAAAFGVVYGLCLQLLNRGPMHTNLLPRDIVLDRVVRNKKPWAVGALSLLMVGMVSHHAMLGQAYRPIRPDIWTGAESAVKSADQKSQDEFKKDSDIKNKLNLYKNVGAEVSKGAERRMMCLELYKAIEASLNRDESLLDKSPTELPFKDRMDFHVTRVEQMYFDNLATWYQPAIKQAYNESIQVRKQLGCEMVERPADKNPDPTGPGWVIELRGYHLFNGLEKKGLEGASHVQKYLINFLENGSVRLPGSQPGEVRDISLFDLGIRRPVLRNKDSKPNYAFRMPNPEYLRILEEKGGLPASAGPGGGSRPGFGGGVRPGFGGGGGTGASLGGGDDESEAGSGGSGGAGFGGGGAAAPSGSEPIKDAAGNIVPPDFEAPKFEFIVQFAWKPGDLMSATGPAVAAPAPAPAVPGPAGFDDFNSNDEDD